MMGNQDSWEEPNGSDPRAIHQAPEHAREATARGRVLASPLNVSRALTAVASLRGGGYGRQASHDCFIYFMLDASV